MNKPAPVYIYANELLVLIMWWCVCVTSMNAPVKLCLKVTKYAHFPINYNQAQVGQK